MEEMKSAYGEAASELQDAQEQMKKVADMLENGALLGDAGELFADAIKGTLVKKMKALEDKMRELEQDIKGAVEATRDGVKTAQSRFK
jgi:uncharacterized protein YukE